MRFNVQAIKYSLQHNLSAEYLMWIIFKELDYLNFKNGKIDVTSLIPFNFCNSTIKRKFKTNDFFSVDGAKAYCKSTSKINSLVGKSRKLYFECKPKELSTILNRLGANSKNIIKKLDSTAIKYLFICIFASQYGSKKPYALQLISEDLGISISTIKRALRSLKIKSYCKEQKGLSPRSYRISNGTINLSPNYYIIQIGEFLEKK